MEKPARNRVVVFDLFASASLAAGLRSLGPLGGFRDTSTPHFMKLECLRCGEETIKDICLYALESGGRSCTDAFGARTIRTTCHPTCPNPAHLVRKCKTCKSLGSVELFGVGDGIRGPERVRAMRIACLGYKPLPYSPGPGWHVSTAAGRLLKATYANDGSFIAYDQDDVPIYVPGVEFEIVELSGSPICLTAIRP